MADKTFNLKKHLIIMTSVVFFILLVFGFSYYAVYKFTYAGDWSMYGKQQSMVASEIRNELLKQPNMRSISFTTSDHVNLKGLLLSRNNATANLMICHGYKASKEFLYNFYSMFPNWNILTFDFRAHGESEGHITSIGVKESQDVIAAAHFFRNTTKTPSLNDLPLIIIGISMGGASTLKAATQKADLCDIIICDSSYADLGQTMWSVFSKRSSLPSYPFFHVAKLIFRYLAGCNIDHMCPENYVESIAQPILFIHSRKDSFTSPDNVLRLYANAQYDKCKLWIGPPCRHGGLHSYHGDLYKHKVSAFIKKQLPNLVV